LPITSIELRLRSLHTSEFGEPIGPMMKFDALPRSDWRSGGAFSVFMFSLFVCYF